MIGRARASTDSRPLLHAMAAAALLVAAALGSSACAPAASPEIDRATIALEALCEKRCRCESCRREERGLCTTDARNTPALARRSHCDAPLDAWVKCQDAMAACLGDHFVDQGCESQRKALDACVAR
jgi:hypothetical protein